jgi:hypothetical protein
MTERPLRVWLNANFTGDAGLAVRPSQRVDDCVGHLVNEAAWQSAA